MREGPTQLTALLLGKAEVVSLVIYDLGHMLMSVNISDEAFTKAVRGLVEQAKAFPESSLNSIKVGDE
jgi:hypothetical protein